MQNKDNILEELRLISEFVAAIPRGVPAPYIVPEGYFEGLAGKVRESILAQKQNPYTVPQGYFGEFAGKLLARIKAGQSGDTREELSVLSPLLDRIDKKVPFEVPEGYFSNLTGNVLSGVQAIGFVNDELENLSPLMTGLRNKTVYGTPEGYFDNLADSVLDKLQRQASPATAGMARVISMTDRRSRTKNWLRYSVAAVATGLILTIGWMGFHSNAPTVSSDLVANNLSKVSDQEILNYLENQNIPLAETMANSSATTLDFSDADVKNSLGNVSDDELKQYLDNNDGTKDPVTN